MSRAKVVAMLLAYVCANLLALLLQALYVQGMLYIELHDFLSLGANVCVDDS